MTTNAKVGETHTVTPADQLDEPEASRISYELRTPTVYDRARLRSAVAELGDELGVRVYLPDAAEIRGELEEGIRRVYDAAGEPAKAEQFLELCAQVYDLIDTEGQAEAVEGVTISDMLSEYGELERTIRRAWSPYNRLLVDLENWRELIRTEAGRLLLVDAANVELTIDAGKGARRQDWGALPASHVAEVGAFALGLFGPRGPEGNG